MTREDCENYIYESYLRAEPHLPYNVPDSQKRHPELTKAILDGLSGTPTILVTGSKGKGSVSRMIAEVLQAETHVGLFTSPHLVDFLERFQVDGMPILENEFISAVEALKPQFDRISQELPPSRFISPMGIQAAIALFCFRRRKTSWNVLECGKGARFDDVNNVAREYSVINSIFLEHTRELGKTVGEIAADKATVIKPGQCAAFSAQQSREAMEHILSRARDVSVPLRVYGEDFDAQNIEWTDVGMRFDARIGRKIHKGIVIPLLGEHQARNCALALAVCEEIMQDLAPEQVRERLARLSWPGRLEVLSTAPFILLDACINRASCEYVLQAVSMLQLKNINVVIGIPDDKDYVGVASALQPIASAICLAKSTNLHYRFTDIQQETLLKAGIQVGSMQSVDQLMETAFARNTPTIILGTTAIVSEVKKWQICHQGKLHE